jgi:hypothetical protein
MLAPCKDVGFQTRQKQEIYVMVPPPLDSDPTGPPVVRGMRKEIMTLQAAREKCNADPDCGGAFQQWPGWIAVTALIARA